MDNVRNYLRRVSFAGASLVFRGAVLMFETPDEIMSLDELAIYLKISKSTLYKLVQQGGFPGQKVGKQWRFHKSAVDDWLRANPHPTRGRDTNQDGGA